MEEYVLVTIFYINFIILAPAHLIGGDGASGPFCVLEGIVGAPNKFSSRYRSAEDKRNFVEVTNKTGNRVRVNKI